MLAVSAAELASIRAEAALAVCDQVCVISRKSTTQDGMGTGSDTYNVINTTTAGVRQPGGSLLANYAFAIESLATYLVLLPYGTDVRHQDHLLIAGETLEAHVILSPQSYSIFENVLAAQLK